jgi:hypothetical protein
MSNYGQFLEEATGGILLSYKEFGSWQGDYIAIIEKLNEIHIYKGSYGSCSGCDWLQDAGEDVETDGGEYTKVISRKEKDDYLNSYPPFLVIPKEQVPDTLEDFKTLLPANTRIDVDDEEDGDPYALVFEQLKHPEINNLEYLEKKYDEQNS